MKFEVNHAINLSKSFVDIGCLDTLLIISSSASQADNSSSVAHLR